MCLLVMVVLSLQGEIEERGGLTSKEAKKIEKVAGARMAAASTWHRGWQTREAFQWLVKASLSVLAWG